MNLLSLAETLYSEYLLALVLAAPAIPFVLLCWLCYTACRPGKKEPTAPCACDCSRVQYDLASLKTKVTCVGNVVETMIADDKVAASRRMPMELVPLSQMAMVGRMTELERAVKALQCRQ
jgi:hypothetical protein